jgi:hypothetical protein
MTASLVSYPAEVKEWKAGVIRTRLPSNERCRLYYYALVGHLAAYLETVISFRIINDLCLYFNDCNLIVT